jgi:type II secretory pathway component GspD/PulD (secretin)
MLRAICLLFLCVVLAGTATQAQPTTKVKKTEVANLAKDDDAAAVKKRFVYLVRYGDAKQLAATLTQHFKDETALQIVPEGTSNALLVTATPVLADELIKTLDQLDRRPRQVLVDVLIAEVPLQEKEHGFDPADFGGPSDTVLPKVEDLARKAKLNHLRRFQVATLENQPGKVQVGENKPMVVGVTARGGLGGPGGGPAAVNSISYMNTGTTLSATPRLGADGTVTLELQIEGSRLVVPEDGVPLGNGVNAAETIKTTFTGKVNVGNGKTALAEGVKTEAKDKKVQSIIVVAAKIVEK